MGNGVVLDAREDNDDAIFIHISKYRLKPI